MKSDSSENSPQRFLSGPGLIIVSVYVVHVVVLVSIKSLRNSLTEV